MEAKIKFGNPTKKEKVVIGQWLAHHDREFYGDDTKYKSARNRLVEETGIKKNFLGMARKVCKFWRQPKVSIRRSTRRLMFDGREWEKLREWITKHRDEINLTLDTAASVNRAMRLAGLLCSVEATHEALMFQRIDLSKNPPKWMVEPVAPKAALETKAANLSPVMRQYQQFKKQYPDFVLFFRMGDFYELFFEDAEMAARVLGITLTKRGDVPMAGVPFHAVEAYLKKLIAAGHKAAICEQVENSVGKKIERRVVRQVAPSNAADAA